MTTIPNFAAFVQAHILAASSRPRNWSIPTSRLITCAERAAEAAVKRGLCQPAPADWFEP